MKYPQLVSMPSAVSDWLEEQLEARGIDSIVYTRYVLSLLHRDPCDLACTDSDLSELTQLKSVGRSSIRGRRRVRNHALSPGDVEQLQRSAVVECLMSASEQKTGIESLVDELCTKLKEIESQSVSSDKFECSQKSPDFLKASPHDLACRYYAAFPALISKSSVNENDITIIPQQVCDWSDLNKQRNVKNLYSNSENPHKLQNISCSNMTKCTNKPYFTYFGRSKEELAFNWNRTMARSVERCEGVSMWDEQVNRYNQQNITADDKHSETNTISIISKPDKELSALTVTESNLSKPIQNQSVETYDCQDNLLYSPLLPDKGQLLHDLDDEFQDLPVDFKELLASPTDQTPSAELFGYANKQGNFVQQTRPFLQCGTNITSSIWSQQEKNDLMGFSVADNSFYDSFSLSNFNNENLALKTSDFKSVSSNIWSDNYKSTKCIEQQSFNDYYENLKFVNNNNVANIDSSSNDQKSTFLWEIGFPLDDDSKILKDDNSKYLKLLEVDSLFDRPSSTNLDTIENSLSKLNHDKEVSCFREVIPKSNLWFSKVNCNNEPNVIHKQLEIRSNTDDDDLLTSLRTHFCPIRLENLHHGTQRLPDGSTFDIGGSPEQVCFQRSDSGALYLESEKGDPPKKYMEYKGDHGLAEENSRSLKTAGFVLKFCVRQNEKDCQTDSDDLFSDGSQEIVPAKRRVISDTEEFFFPGDEDLAELISDFKDSMTACICQQNEPSEQDDFQSLPIGEIRTDGECSQCGYSSWFSDNTGLWSGEDAWRHIWSSRIKLCLACGGEKCSEAPAAPRCLREEVSLEGEQLLSDISSLRCLYSFDICGDERPSSGREERKRRHSACLRPNVWHPMTASLRALTF